MRERGMRKVLVWVVLLALVLGQGNMAFAAPPPKPQKPPVVTTSSLDITTDNLTYSLPENEPFEFYVDATTKEGYTIIWGPDPSEDGLLDFVDVVKTQKTTKKTTNYLEKARFVYTPIDDDQEKTVVYTIFASEFANNTTNKDQITVTFKVIPVISETNSPPVAVDDQVEGVVGTELLIQPLLNDTDLDGDIINLVSVKDEYGKDIPFDGSDIRFTPLSAGNLTLNYVISDGEFTSEGTITIIVIEKSFVYLALGDSIPAGVSYEYNLTGGLIESYTDKMYTNLGSQFANVVYHDKSISGMNIYLSPSTNTTEITLYDQVMLDSNIRDYIASADLITLCIGANDIMDAAQRNLFNIVNFYQINWDTAKKGRETFELYWPLIIAEINALNPDVELLVMTVYNPYNFSDNGSYNVGEGQDVNLKIHDQVDLYLSGTSESSRGINTIIRNYEFNNDYSLNYKVVDVYSHFESRYGDSKGSVTGFYGLPSFFGIPVKDPHPDKTGQNEIYNLHLNTYQQMN